MESLHLIPLHHRFYDGVGGGLQEALVPIGIQWVGEVLDAAVACRTGAGAATNRGSNRLDPLQEGGRRDGKGREG